MTEKKKVKHRPGEILRPDQQNLDKVYKRKDTDYKRWPDRFKEEYCEDIIEFLASGKSITQWLVKVGISADTLRYWMNKYPHFAEAKKLAVQASMAAWESIGERGTVGEITGFRDATYRFMMKNRFPHFYKDVHNIEQTTTVKFETYVNEYGQIINKKQDLLDGEVIDENETGDASQTTDNTKD